MKKAQTIQKTPLVSVVIPVYNVGSYLSDAIESILTQTYTNIELIMIDDHSTDNSYGIMKDYAKRYPKKIKILQNCHHHHLAHVMCKALTKVKGEFIARMDGDDISLPTRIEKQVAYLQKHKKTVAVGTQCHLINQDGVIIGEKTFPQKHAQVYRYIYSFCPMQHPTMMIAANRLPKNFTYYNVKMPFAEDIDLIFKLFQHGKVENLKEKLFLYRMHGNNITTKNIKKVFFMTLIARIRAVISYEYKPHPHGVFMTLGQTIAIFLLPQSASTLLYALTRKVILKPQNPQQSFAFQTTKAV